MRVFEKNALQTVSVFAAHYLPGVAFADGGNAVAVIDSAFHEIYAAAELDGHILSSGNTEKVLYNVGRKLSLIFYVMNGKYCFDTLKRIAVLIEKLVINGYKRGMPVVAMQNVDVPVKIRNKLQHRAGEKCETLAVVAVTVKPRPLEIIFVVDEIKFYALVLEFEQAAILIAPCQRNGYRTDERKFFSVFCGEIFIKRQNHTGFHRTQFVECARKRADNLTKSARPRERPCLRRGKKNVLDLIFRRFYGVFCVFGIFL